MSRIELENGVFQDTESSLLKTENGDFLGLMPRLRKYVFRSYKLLLGDFGKPSVATFDEKSGTTSQNLQSSHPQKLAKVARIGRRGIQFSWQRCLEMLGFRVNHVLPDIGSLSSNSSTHLALSYHFPS